MAPTRANGKICYLEIPTADVPRSVRFYQAVFGWQIRRRGDGATAFDDGVWEVSGAWVSGRPASPVPGLLLYVMVDSVSQAVDAVVRAFPWPKSMTWGSGTLRWVRPIRRILCLFDGRVVPFAIDGIESGSLTRGHRFMGPGEPFSVNAKGSPSSSFPSGRGRVLDSDAF